MKNRRRGEIAVRLLAQRIVLRLPSGSILIRLIDGNKHHGRAEPFLFNSLAGKKQAKGRVQDQLQVETEFQQVKPALSLFGLKRIDTTRLKFPAAAIVRKLSAALELPSLENEIFRSNMRAN